MKELSKERIRGRAAVDGDGYQDINDASWSFSDAGLQKFAAAIIKEDRALNAPADRDVTREAPVTVLPDGSAFFTGSFPLPKDHWLYAPRCSEWDSVRDITADTPHPILTHEARTSVVAAVRYAVRGATMCGAEKDFDPDAIVQNAVYALCGPDGDSTAALNAPPADRDAMRQAVTEEMATAYLTASNRYWRETDKWRNGTALEATRVSLEAALAAAPTPPAEPARKPLFAELIASHEGLAEELKAMDAAPPAEQQGAQEPDYKCMFAAAVSQIGEISDALGIDADEASCANGNDLILAAIERKNRAILAAMTRRPSPFAELRAEVEKLPAWIDQSPHRLPTLCMSHADVLALIDKMGVKS